MAPIITPFKIAIPDSSLETLQTKLKASVFPDDSELYNNWEFGAPQRDIQRLAEYWADGFDWRKQEAKLNELPQFKTTVSVDGFGELGIHFVHQRSEREGSIPLLFCHGWPGSYIEVLKILPLLTNPKDGGQSFHVVAPSLPNFGWSDGPKKPGFGIPQHAEAMHKVMLALGYDQYVTQGGDWGFIVTRLMGVRYPQHCLATHINMIRANPPALSSAPLQFVKHAVLPYSEEEKVGIERSKWFMKEGFGYNLLQGTKPSTIGFALADSPVALLAWIYEKLHDWTDSYPWTDDEILTWISIYAFSTAGPAASARIYYESRHADQELTAKGLEYNGAVKLGLSYFPKDLTLPPKTWGRTLGPVVSERVHKDGGHFAAHERPEELVGDLRDMFGEGGGAWDVTKRLRAKKEAARL